MDTNLFEKYFGDVTRICTDAYGKKELSVLFDDLLAIDGLPMHCPVHHYIVPAALLAATRSKQGRSAEAFAADLTEALERALEVPGGFCGFSGCCGAAVGVGIFWSIVTGSTPMSETSWGFIQSKTAETLLEMAKHGGPRCCKRCSTIALASAATQVGETLKLDLGWRTPERCDYQEKNDDCTKEHCPFYHEDEKV